MRTANLTRDETAARAAGIRLDTVDVELDLREARDLALDTFPTRSTFVFSATVAQTWIDFLGVSVDEVVVNGEQRPIAWDGARLQLRDLAAHNVVTVRGRGRFSTSGEGLHRFVDPVDDEVYLYTQYEPADCRRVYPCFEQPDLKARWRFRVSAPHGWEVLSGGAEAGREEIDGGVRVAFAETLPLSSYITAVAAGPYHRVDGAWDGPEGAVALGVLCRASLAVHLDAEKIIDVTRRGLSLFTEAFASPYPWGKYDQIFVPEYNLGAMENPGLVTFTEKYVFRGRATAAQHEARANTILHEMAHMWFGDLVTMRWWDDLWLKESFADFMGTYANVHTGAHPDAWVAFATRRKGWAYVQDQLPTTHPIVADIPDLEAAKLNFDGITYAKGAAVLKQLVAYVGEDAFFRGAQRYFADHAFGNTTLEDLLVALESASGRPLRAWSDAWLRTSGVSALGVERVAGDRLGLEAVLSEPRPQRFGVGLYADTADGLVRRAEVTADVSGSRTRLSSAADAVDDIALIIPNEDDTTYAKVRLDAASTAAVARSLSTIGDPLARAVVWASLWNATRDGELAVARYIDIVSRHAQTESHVALLTDALAHVSYAIAHYAAVSERRTLADGWLETVWGCLHDAAPGSDAQVAWARALGAAATRSRTHAAEIAEMLSGARPAPEGLRLDPDLRWSWLIALSATGDAGAAEADAELAADLTATGAVAHRTALAARPDAGVRAAAWTAAWSDAALTNDHLDATIAGARAGGRRDLLADFDDDYFARILPAWTGRSIEIARRLVVGLFPASDTLDPVDAWLADNADAPGALRRLIIEQRDTLARDLRVRAAQAVLTG